MDSVGLHAKKIRPNTFVSNKSAMSYSNAQCLAKIKTRLIFIFNSFFLCTLGPVPSGFYHMDANMQQIVLN